MMELYCESCEKTLFRFEDDYLDLVITSPPYYNAKEYSQYDSVNSYMMDMGRVFSLIFNKMKPSRMCVINISPVLVSRKSRSSQSYRIPLPFYFVPMMEKIGFEFLEDIIWQKPDGSAPNRNGGFFRHRKPIAYKPNIVTEYILVFKKPSVHLIDKYLKNDSLVHGEYERTNVWKINPETKSWHPAPFPEKLVENVIRYYSYENDIIYDPFAGSGTVGRVGLNLNRNVILSEIKIEYCNKMSEIYGWKIIT